MSTGTIQGRATTLSKLKNEAGLRLTMNNGEGAEIKNGTEVTLTGDNTVSIRDTATELPFGICEVGGADGEKVTVHVFGQRTLNCVATGGAFAAGDFVKYEGTHNADGVPNYVAAASGDKVNAIVLKGAAQDSVSELVILTQYELIP